MSMIYRDGHSQSLTLPVSTGLKRYSFVNWVPHGASLKTPHKPSKNMADECERLDAILFMADCSACFADGSLGGQLDDTLQGFRRFCKLPWLAGKDVILVLLNIDNFYQKLLECHSKRNDYPETPQDMIDRFLSINEDESRKIHVILVDNDSAKNLESLEGAVKHSLNKKKISALMDF